jgi:hypothetical protein
MLDRAFAGLKSWPRRRLVDGQDQHPKGDSHGAKLLASGVNGQQKPNETAASRGVLAAPGRRGCVDKEGTAGQNENAFDGFVASVRLGVNILGATPIRLGWVRICARMAELADALRSGRSSRKGVEVRVLFRAPSSSKLV